jgi:hypothetical protein
MRRIPTCISTAWYMHDFSREIMVPVLRMLLSPSPQEIAVRDTYYKMCLLLRSALVMNNLEHFQNVASLTRSIFELWLDLKIPAKDQTGEDVRKYNEFPEIERYRRRAIGECQPSSIEGRYHSPARISD